MADIFLSYRRQDSQSATGRLADRLEEHFGPERVFRDHESIVAGEDFAEAIRRAVSTSTVLLVIIGPRWLAAASANGTRRLDDPGDYVRLEIELALEADVAVVPVLVEDATMPPESELPPSLAAFARCQAIELSDSRWRYDADQLIAALQSRFAIESQQPSLDGAPPGAGFAARAARIATDLLDFAARPARMIARRQTGHASDPLRAFLFLLASIGAGNLALLSGLSLHPSSGTLLPGPWFALLTWLAAGEFVGIFAVALLSMPLMLAWRLTGTRAPYRQVLGVFAYLYSGLWLGFCAGALMFGAGAQLVDPTVFDRVVGLMNPSDRAPTAAEWAEGRALLANAYRGPALGPALGLALIGTVVWAGTVVWLVIAWGAFRKVFGVGRLRAGAAALLWLAAIAGVASLLQHVA